MRGDPNFAAMTGVVLRKAPADNLVTMRQADAKTFGEEIFDRLALGAHFFGQKIRVLPLLCQQFFIGRSYGKPFREHTLPVDTIGFVSVIGTLRLDWVLICEHRRDKAFPLVRRVVQDI